LYSGSVLRLDGEKMQTIKPMCKWNDTLEIWEKIPPTKKNYQTTLTGEILEERDLAYIKRFGPVNSADYNQKG